MDTDASYPLSSSREPSCCMEFTPKECRTAKIVAFVVALIFVAISLTLHFQNINSIAVYSTGAAAGVIVLAIALHSVVGCIKQPREVDEGRTNGTKISLRFYRSPYWSAEIRIHQNLSIEDGEILDEFLDGIESIPPSDKDTPYVFVDQSFTVDNVSYTSGWYTAGAVAYAAGYSEDPSQLTPTQQARIDQQEGPFLFALAFSNCPIINPESEPSIFMPDPMPGKNIGNPVEFPSVAFYMEYFKYTLYLESLAPSDTTGKVPHLCKEYRRKIDTHKDPRTVATMNQNVPFTKETLQQWEQKKAHVMRAAVYAKFAQNPLHGEMLKSTVGLKLVDLTALSEEDKEASHLLTQSLVEVRDNSLLSNRSRLLHIGDRSFVVPEKKPEIDYGDLYT